MNTYGISAALSATLAFMISLVLGKVLIPALRKLKYGQTILEVGPSWHKNKQGTPTMGGIIFIIAIVISTVICVPSYYKISELTGLQVYETPLMLTKIFAGLAMAVGFGIIGFIDDYVKVKKKQNKGLTPKQKLILQFGVAGCYLLSIYNSNKINGGESLAKINFPFLGVMDFSALGLELIYWILCAVLIVGIVNAANFTDGIDGLHTSVTFFIAVFFMIITNILGMFGLSLQAAALAGGCLGFLIWNLHPAKVFMGDTGSLFLGGIVCALGLGANLHVPLIMLSLVYICEILSVVIQVIYFKLSGGKRLFKMSPIHHHFEMIGWSENKICIIFSLVTAFWGIISVWMVLSHV